MTFKRLCGIQDIPNGIAESTFASIAKKKDRFELCRVYETMVNNDDLNTQDIKTLQLKYPTASRKCIRRWRRGIKPTSWKTYIILIDPDCCYENISLLMDRHGVSDATARKAIELSWKGYREESVEDEPEMDYGWPSPRRAPSPLSPLLARWGR